nr:hypothetical protein [Nanoarchaeum sp.]
MEKAILLNFAYGHGPFLRSLDVAKELNHIITLEGNSPYRIISPLINEKKQRGILSEEKYKEVQELVIFDKDLGDLLNEIFYKGEDYQENLRFILDNYDRIEKKFRNRVKELQREYDIQLEIGRNQRISSGLPRSYCVTMGLFSEFIREAILNGLVNNSLGKDSIKISKHIEDSQRRLFVSEPHILDLKEPQIGVPFIVEKMGENLENLNPGVYVYNSGIENLTNNLPEIKGLRVYDSREHNPKITTNKNIEAVITRAGLGTVSDSLLAEKPLVILPYQKGDDFEIYFNIQRFKRLDLVQVYDSSLSFEENLRLAKSKLKNIQNYKTEIMRKYGTLDGVKYTANLINQDLKN